MASGEHEATLRAAKVFDEPIGVAGNIKPDAETVALRLRSICRMKKPRPQSLSGITPEVPTGHGNLHITINFENGQPFEVFGNIGKAGGCAKASMEAICRLVSLALRSGVPVEEIVDQLQGITCCPIYHDGEQVKSPADAIARALKRAKSAASQTEPTQDTTPA